MHPICQMAYRLALALGVVLLVCMTAVVCLNIVSRYFFGYSFSWSEEAARYMMVWMTMIGAAMAIRKWSHFRLEFVEHKVSSRARLVLRRIDLFVALAIGLLLVWQGLVWLPLTNHQLATALQLPMSWFYAALPVAGMLIVLFSFEGLLDGLGQSKPATDTEPPVVL
jgi:TRAP-type transport system small permease protein